MLEVKDLIKEYLLNTIQTKKNMRKRIYQLEEQNKELKLGIADAIKQKDIYKNSNKKLRKQITELKEKKKGK